MTNLPDPLPIRARGPLDARIRVPGSRSITNRALVAAALAEGESRLEGAASSDDTDVMREGLRELGARITMDSDAWTVVGVGGRFGAPRDTLFAGASGTTARFLTAAATLAAGPALVDGIPRMRERPIQDLVDALRALGADCEARSPGGCPPVRVAGGGLPGGRAAIDARRSSQYVSAVLLAAPYAERDVELSFVEGVLVSRPFVDLTLEVMHAFDARASWRGEGLLVRAGHPYRSRVYRIEPDAQSAVYGFAAAAIAGGRVRVDGIPAKSRQTDLLFLDALRAMGCRVERTQDAVEVRSPQDALRGVDIDMNAMPDAALAMAVVALFARGATTIRNIANLRIKETDRLDALETQLRKLGGKATAGPDWLRIEPAPLHGAAIDTYDDHRIAMAFALAGLRVPGVAIRDPGCVSKTWPNYFDALERLC
jgi:3-phosphoshikimate 1-carboxyvinyltransferase